MTPKIITTQVGTIEFCLVGTGIPLLFVHGGHSNAQETLFHKGFNTKQFCLITPSRPGYGNTPLGTFFSPPDAAKLLVSLLDDLQINKVIVIGISAGGLTAITLSANYPDRVSKLILISAVTKKWLIATDPIYRKGKKIFSPAVEKYSWALFRFFYSVFPALMAKTMFRELSSVRPAAIRKEEISELQTMIKEQRSYCGFINDLDQVIAESDIIKVKCPTLILHSLNDNAVPIEHAQHAEQKIKNAILKTYNNQWGHLLWLGKESFLPIKDTLNFIANN